MELTEITIRDLIENKYLYPGTQLFLDNFEKEDYSCKITADSKLEVSYHRTTKKWDYPSGAAKSLLGMSVNGWIRWYFLDDKIERVYLSDLRLLFYEGINKKGS